MSFSSNTTNAAAAAGAGAPSFEQLPPPRLVITTTNTSSGISHIESDAAVPLFRPFGPTKSAFSRFWSRLSVPVNNTRAPPAGLANTPPRCPPQGVLFCTTDIMPGGVAPMHRTLSQDYVTVVSGEIVLKLDSGEETVLKGGQFVVMKGVNHSWINKGTEVCRLVVVMVGAEKIALEDGRVLEETVFGPPKK